MRSLQRSAVGVVGVAATVLLHALLFAAASWGDGGSRAPRKLDAVGAGANVGRAEGESGERRIFIELTTRFNDDQAVTAASPYLAKPASQADMLQVAGPDIRPPQHLIFDDEGDAADPSDAELIARTKMAGMYESQIRARIERAWVTPVGEPVPDFSCRARIHQRADGSIREVELDIQRCGHSSRWQQSLVNAIFTASPLPAPPHPSVFVDNFSLMFRAPQP